MTEKTDTIVITGFGPFNNYKVNASWEAVKALMKMPEVKELPVKLVAAEVPVSYEHVLQKVPEFHSNENPVLMIHVGVSSVANEVTLEQCANKDGYSKIDVEGKLPEGQICPVGCETCVSTALDINAMVDDFNQAGIGVAACTSKNAGRSLNQNNRRSLFVHVPELGRPYTAEQLGRGLYEVVRSAVKQLSENELIDRDSATEKMEGASAL